MQSFVKLEAAQAAKEASNPHIDPNSAVKSGNPNDRGFDEMNEVAARMLCHLTSSSR